MNTTFIDTHCHLNFKRFNKTREQVIKESHKKGVGIFVVPGTDLFSSLKAIEIAKQDDSIYVAIGIHPHHTFNKEASNTMQDDMNELEKLITHPKVVAIGEIGLDKHMYEDTKYENYQISDEFLNAQKEYCIAQIRLARKYDKALILHNRETKTEIIDIINQEWCEEMRFRTVFHCCEPDEDLLSYAQAHDIYIGVDGDVTYGGEKSSFIKKVPLTMLVLETDSPFLLPEPLKTQRLYPNTPANIPIIAQYIADLKGIRVEEVAEVTTKNAKRLFNLNK
ncbi:MAG: TatD family hydrolase [Candidatus Roizmanbacteria bacterium]|nr:TatD family hydrolase [Candidatus Roizmanbacteria bacterium]